MTDGGLSEGHIRVVLSRGRLATKIANVLSSGPNLIHQFQIQTDTTRLPINKSLINLFLSVSFSKVFLPMFDHTEIQKSVSIEVPAMTSS